MGIARGVAALVVGKTEPALIGGAGGLHQVRLLVENVGPMRVALGPRDMADDYDGILLGPGEIYTHDGPDPLYARAVFPAKLLANIPAPPAVRLTPTVALRYVQYVADAPGAAAVSGPAFPWPTAPTNP